MEESNLYQKIAKPFLSLKNKTFAKLYIAQTISLLGDAFSWVGLALLSYQISPENSPKILATALTLRVTAFIIFSPFAGVLADKVERKKILLTTHLFRMAIICSLPFVTSEWQIYLLVFFLNVFSAFFTPTYRAIIPQIVGAEEYREAVGLSTATYQLLGILGPALAGFVAVWIGARQIFFLDAITFIVAAMLIFTIPKIDLQKGVSAEAQKSTDNWNNVIKGIKLLFGNSILRFALAIEFVSAIAGAMILVNTINHIKNNLVLDDKYYGWIMAAFGIGAAISAFIIGSLDKSKTRSKSLITGALFLGLAITFANYVPFYALLILWSIAGLGQSLAEMPSETLIAETIPSESQGKVYGSHFAFSHLWWAIAYPIAGFLGTTFPKTGFMYGGILSLTLAIIALLLFYKRRKQII